MSHNRTYDGKPLSMGISGFTEYSTDRPEAPVSPPPVLTPNDIISQLNKLRKVLSLPELDRAMKLLFVHAHDEKNPHHTNLDQFTQQVIDVLFQEYQAQGGVGSREFYVQCLFKTLRVATLEEMKNGADENLLVSIKGAKWFITEHEKNPDAHKELFDKLFPGDPITDNPAYAFNAMFGVSDFLMQKENSDETASTETLRPYSFIGPDGFLHYCGSDDVLPIDYIYGEPLIPCFGKRTNAISESINFNIHTPYNVTFLKDADESPDKTTTATAVFSGRDSMSVEHSVIIKDVLLPFDQQKTFSIFAKQENCRYLSIAYKDMTTSVITVRGIYDLETGSCLSMNHMNRYKAAIQQLSNGWCRCEFSMYHEIGQETDLVLTFFKEKNDQNDISFIGNGELCGYLWGMQLEDGPTASPYIPTDGTAVSRIPIKLILPLESDWWTPEKMTLYMAFLNPKTFLNKSSIRPLCTIVSDDNTTAMSVNFKTDGSLELLRMFTLKVGDMSLPAVIYQDIFPASNNIFCQLTHGIDSEQIISRYNDNMVIRSETPSEWDAGLNMYLGCDQNGNFLEGYIRNLTLYPIRVTRDQSIFLNGEEIHG